MSSYRDCDLIIYPCSDTPDGKSEITRAGLAGSNQEATIMPLFQEQLIRLLTSDVCMKPPAQERLHKVSLLSCPTRTHFPVRNGLVNQVEFFGLITRKGTNEIARSVIIT